MLSATACLDESGKSQFAGRKLEYWKYCLTIVSLVLISIQIQAQNEWTHITDLPTHRSAATACVIDNKIYVIGGTDGYPNYNDLANNEVYDPSTGIWDTLAPMPTPRGFLSSGVVNGIIYAIGGGYPISTMKNEAYNPLTDTWDTTKADLLSPRRAAQAGVVDGIIYTIGGNSSSRDCEAYDPVANSWTSKTAMPGGGGDLAVTVYNGLIYTFGGGYYTVGPYSNVYAYNPQTDTWDTTLTPMPTPRFAFQTYLVGDKIYAILGSQSQNTSLATVEVYDPATDTWATLPDIPDSLAWFAGAVVSDSIYVIGGSPDWQTGGVEVWKYTPPSIPVELTSFTASAIGKDVTLNWSTATETNNQGFEIERRIINGGISKDWNKIGFTPGFGTTTEPNEYSYVDNISGVNANALAYRLKQVDFDGSYEYTDEVFVDNLTPIQFVLEQNYPNPFNPTTKISWQSPVGSWQTLNVYDILGNEVATLVDEYKSAGKYEVEFNSASSIKNQVSGVYFYQLRTGNFVETKKMILIK